MNYSQHPGGLCLSRLETSPTSLDSELLVGMILSSFHKIHFFFCVKRSIWDCSTMQFSQSLYFCSAITIIIIIYSFNTLLRLFIVNKYFYRRQNHRKDHVVVYTLNKKILWKQEAQMKLKSII